MTIFILIVSSLCLDCLTGLGLVYRYHTQCYSYFENIRCVTALKLFVPAGLCTVLCAQRTFAIFVSNILIFVVTSKSIVIRSLFVSIGRNVPFRAGYVSFVDINVRKEK